MEPKQIQSDFFDQIESFIIQYSNDLFHKHQQNLESFSSLFKELSNSLTIGQKENPENWKKLEFYLNSLQEWVNSYDCDLAKYNSEDLLREYLARLEVVKAQVPEVIKIGQTKELLQKGDKEPLFLSIWKRNQKLKTGLINLFIRVVNFFRKLFRKPLLKSYIGNRVFRFLPVYSQYLEVPLIHHLKERQNTLLQIIFKQLFDLHLQSEHLKDELLNIEEFESLMDQHAGEKLTEIKSVNHVMQLISEYQKELGDFEVESYFHFKEFRENTESKFNLAWDQAGTYYLPSWLVGRREKSRGIQSTIKQLTFSQQSWMKHAEGEKGDWLTDIELFEFQTDIALQCYHTMQIIHNKIHDSIIPALNQVNTIVQDSIKNFTLIDTEKAELRKKILLENRSLLRQLGREKLPELIDLVSQSRINQAFKGFLSIVEDNWSEKSDEHVIFKVRDLEHSVPDSKTDRVPLKNIVNVEILSPLKSAHEKIYLSSQQKLDDILRAISEIDQIIEYNLEAALSLFETEVPEEQIDDIRQIVVEGLERTGNQVNKLNQDFQDLLQHYDSVLPENTLELEQGVQALSRSENVIELKIRYLRAQTRENIINYRSRIWKGLKTALKQFWGALSVIALKMSAGIFRLRKISRLAPAGIKIDERLSNYLTQTEDKILHLPYIYQRLFRQEPLTDKRFYFEEKKALDVFRESLIDWQNGKSISILLTGERGSGKTTILNFAVSDIIAGHKKIRIDLNQTVFTEQGLLNILKEAFSAPEITSFTELENKILQYEQKIICIFENIHNLYIRTIDGFIAIERLMLFMSRTQQKIFWIATCALYGFHYLDLVIKVSKYFNRNVSPGNKSKDDIREIILKRHRMSGYNLEFQVPKDLEKSRKFHSIGSETEKQKIIQDYYFEKLSGLSAGNIRVALFFWLSSIQDISKDKMIISPDLNFDFTFVQSLPADIMFSFAALIQHENLNEKNHALIFNQNEFDSALVLNRLYNKGYLQKNGSDYFVHPFLYRPIVKVLNSQNIIH